MAALEYISLADVKAQDDLLSGVVKQVNIDRANDEIENLAKRRDVAVSDIANPIHSYLKDFGIFFCLERVAGGRSGSNPRSFRNNVESEPYYDKAQFYRKMRHEMETLLTSEVISGTQQLGSDFANPTIPFYRTN